MLSWAARTPGKAAPSPALLAGICVKVESAGEERYHFLPLEGMGGNDAVTRLQALFAIKPGYRQEELEPYLSPLVGGAGQPKAVPELLLLHARLVEGVYLAKT